MDQTKPQPIDWQAWLRRWDEMQAGYFPEREKRFDAMLDALEALLPDEFTALDLASGPGAISQRLLARFPGARSIAVDYDPALLALGKGALGDCGGRLKWVEANIAQSNWVERLGVGEVDAVLSTTALHWLYAHELLPLFRQLGKLIRPGGVFLNGDHLHFAQAQGAFRQVAEKAKEKREREAFQVRGVERWESWWSALANEPEAKGLCEERDRRFSSIAHEDTAPIFDVHVAGLTDAGFSEVGVIWQNADNRILMAVR